MWESNPRPNSWNECKPLEWGIHEMSYGSGNVRGRRARARARARARNARLEAKNGFRPRTTRRVQSDRRVHMLVRCAFGRPARQDPLERHQATGAGEHIDLAEHSRRQWQAFEQGSVPVFRHGERLRTRMRGVPRRARRTEATSIA